MSQWTHIAGVIRIDALRDGDERDMEQEKALKGLFRKFSARIPDSLSIRRNCGASLLIVFS